MSASKRRERERESDARRPSPLVPADRRHRNVAAREPVTRRSTFFAGVLTYGFVCIPPPPPLYYYYHDHSFL